MTNFKTILSSVVAAIIVVAVALGVYHPGASQPITTNQPVVRGVSSDFSNTRNLNVGGVLRWEVAVPMKAATTTLCAIQAPQSTSTLVHASFIIRTGTSTAATIDIGTSTTAFGTTTNLVTAKSIGSGAQGNAYWTSTGGSVDDAIMSPNTWLVVKTAGAGLSGYTYGGTCEAEFLQL